MPWSVFFDDNGRAFHGGDPARQSAGCVRMADPDAQAFFNGLEVYDRVQIVE
jgi:lipoprotein-anchoring transpeptidase ErfK/SrfK